MNRIIMASCYFVACFLTTIPITKKVAANVVRKTRISGLSKPSPITTSNAQSNNTPQPKRSNKHALPRIAFFVSTSTPVFLTTFTITSFVPVFSSVAIS